MTKSELIAKLTEVNNRLTRKDSEAVINLVFDSITDALKSGEVVSIPSKRAPFFKTGKELRERVNVGD